MPLSEFLRRARGQLGSGKQETCPLDISSRGEDGLVELVWDNGQIVMHGQSSSATRSPIIHSSQSIATRVQDSGVENTGTRRIGKFGGDETSVVPSGEVDLLSHNDEIVPWLNFPFDDLPQDYCSELLPEVSGVTADRMAVQHSSVPSDKRCDYTVSNLCNDGNGLKDSSSKAHMVCSWPTTQQGQISDPSRGSDVISDGKINCVNVNFGTSAHGRSIVNDPKVLIGPSNNDSSLLNFSHFSRPALLAKAKVPNFDGIPEAASFGMERQEKVSASIGTNPVKSTFSARIEDTHKDFDFRDQPATAAMAHSRQQVLPIVTKEPFLAANTAKIGRVSSMKNDKHVVQTDVSDLTKGSARTSEPMVASSSVGSNNRANMVSCEKLHSSKRKIHEIEVSECRSDETETECIGAKKATDSGGTGSKRSRAAEVHNLSERRRRDRINEKMRALQELVPNCNKADKASMLDEAIEYLKTLQLQVQMMSMGAGLCMPPMMFPPGIQHMHPAHAPHFSPMGMGMAMGFGAGMLDMNGGGTLGCPIFPIPPMQGTHFPPPIPGHGNFQRIPGSNFPVFGHPIQGFHNSVTSAPSVPLMRPPVSSAMDLSTSKIESHNGGHNTSPTFYAKDPSTNHNPLPMHDDKASSSRNRASNQLHSTNQMLDQPTSEQEDKQTGQINVTVALTSAAETEFCKETGCD